MAQDDERKVPPRTPPQRLNTLHRFFKDWVNANIGTGINRPSRATNMIEKGLTRLEGKMTEAYAKDCHFFDPTVEHGGPNPATQSKSRFVNNSLIPYDSYHMTDCVFRKTTRNFLG